MRWKTCVAFAALVALASITSQAATIVDYNLTGLTTATPLPVTTPATTVSPGLSSANPISRGPGVNPAGLTNGFSADNWTNVTADGGTIDLARAIAMGDYFQFGFTVDATHSVSLSGFDTNLRRSAIDGPRNFELQYSFDQFATPGTTAAQFMYLGRSSGTAPGTITPFQWMTTDTPGQGDGNPIQQQNLSTVAGLQNIAPGTTVTFRLYAWNAGATGSANTNTLALGRIQGPLLSGTVTEIPEPASLVLVLAGLVALVGLRSR